VIKIMAAMLFGFVCGILSTGQAGDGWMSGWTVTDASNRTICVDPWVWSSFREIQCDNRRR
jgi:hypothetical protein